MKTKALDRIDEKMSLAEEGSIRYQILACAKNFKSSWLNLGQYLVTVHKDKLYKDWGYLTFEAYCKEDIGIRKETSLKLLRSYYFLEKEEPEYIKKEYLEAIDAHKIPSYEAVDTLRQIKSNKDFGIADYERVKRQVFEEGKADKEVKDVYRQMLKSVREDDDPEEAHSKRRLNYIRRMLGALNSIKKEAEINKFLPVKIISELEHVIEQITAQLT